MKSIEENLESNSQPIVDTAYENDEGSAWNGNPGLLKLNFSLISLMMFGAAVGYDGSMSNGLQALPQWNAYMGQPKGAWLGFINAIYWIAFGLACPCSAWIANRFGRKKAIYLAFIPLVAGTAVETSAQSPGAWIIGRAILGIPSGMFSNVVPLLAAECSHPQLRGKMTCLYFTGFYIGAIVAAWATFGTRNYVGDWAWRLPCVLQMACPLVALPGLALCPESPRWLMSIGRTDQAHEVLIQAHGNGNRTALVEQEAAEIEVALAQEGAIGSTRYIDMFNTKANLHRALITISLGLYSQWIGNGVVSYYLALVLNTVGITSVTDQTLISGCLQIWNLIFAVAGALVVDRLGRRKLFLLSFAIMLVSYICITAFSGSFAETGKKSVGLAVVPFLYIFFAGYDIAVTPLQGAYPVEIWPYHLRSQGLGLAWMSTVVGIVFNVFVNPIALDAIGWKYYIVFLAVLCSYGVVIYLFYPETRGHSLEHMAIVFEGKEVDSSTAYDEVEKVASKELAV